MNTQSMVSPDSRGRIALGSLIESGRSYSASVGEHGVVTLVPVGAVLSDEQVKDLHEDPQGFADMMKRATEVADGNSTTTSAADFLDES